MLQNANQPKDFDVVLGGQVLPPLGGVVLGAILTPSTDPLTQSLLAGAVIGLYFGGIGLVFLLVNLNGGQKLIQWILDGFKKKQKESTENANSSASEAKPVEVKEETEANTPLTHTSSENPLEEIASNEHREESPAVVAIQEPIENGNSVWADEQLGLVDSVLPSKMATGARIVVERDSQGKEYVVDTVLETPKMVEATA